MARFPLPREHEYELITAEITAGTRITETKVEILRITDTVRERKKTLHNYSDTHKLIRDYTISNAQSQLQPLFCSIYLFHIKYIWMKCTVEWTRARGTERQRKRTRARGWDREKEKKSKKLACCKHVVMLRCFTMFMFFPLWWCFVW